MVRWTDHAVADLREIRKFIERDSPRYGRLVAERLVQATERLEAFHSMPPAGFASNAGSIFLPSRSIRPSIPCRVPTTGWASMSSPVPGGPASSAASWTSPTRSGATASKTPEEIEREREMILGDREVDPLHEHIEHSGVGVDGAGRIWVLTQRWTQGESVFDVFSPGGDYLGESRVDAILRRGSWAVAVRDDRLAGIIEQADGSEQVWVWRIVDGAS